MQQIVYIGLGSNLGDRNANIQQALALLSDNAAVSDIRCSTIYETRPLSSLQQPAFLNAVAQVTMSLSHRQVFALLQTIEQRMGRQHLEHWGPRLIDLDLLLYGDAIIDEPDLKVPHAQMHLRSFVLDGLCQLDPDCVHPLLQETALALSKRLNGQDFFLDAAKPQLVCIAGNIGVGKTTLAQHLANRLGGLFIAENYSGNPYLADVYAGKRDVALDSELFFLSSGASQLEARKLESGRVYIADYVFDKAMIYASNWLNGEQMHEYKRYYESVADGVAVPVLAVYLNDSLEHCLERIHNRNRPYEQRIEKSFLEHLQAGYEKLYRDFTACPVIRITSDQCFTPEQIDRVANEVHFYLAKADS